MLDSGTTGFMLVSTMLVLLMTPGIAFFYGGLVKAKGVKAAYKTIDAKNGEEVLVSWLSEVLAATKPEVAVGPDENGEGGNGQRMMLGRVVVLPEYRGQGLGSAAVHAAEDWARELGFQEAVLESRENKVGFYEKLGYVADPSRVIRGDTFICVYMHKTL